MIDFPITLHISQEDAWKVAFVQLNCPENIYMIPTSKGDEGHHSFVDDRGYVSFMKIEPEAVSPSFFKLALGDIWTWDVDDIIIFLHSRVTFLLTQFNPKDN